MSERRYGEILRKLEDALEDHIQKSTTELITNVGIFKGFSIDDPTSERIEIEAGTAVHEVIGETGTGNWTVDVDIRYIFNYGDGATRESSHAKANALFDLFLQPNINYLINAHSEVDDFWMYGVDANPEISEGTGFEVQAVQPSVIDSHTFVYTMKATAYCRPSGLES